nr:phytanoyl-CoA dioxygenase family protein [Sphingomonas sp. CDS-1]
MGYAEKQISMPSLECLPFGTATEEVIGIVHRDGGIILEGALNERQVAAINAEIDVEMEALQCGSNYGDAEFQAFWGKRTKRLTNVVTFSKTFRDEFLDNDQTFEYASAMFKGVSSSMWLSCSQAIEIQPNEKAQLLHRDVYNYPIFMQMGPSGPEVAFNMIIALCDVTEEMGATRLIPGSHEWDFSDEYTPEMTIPATMKAGSVLFYGAKLVHGGGANVTTDKKRRVLSAGFNIGMLLPEEAYPFVVPMEAVREMPPRVQKLIGFRSFHQREPAGGSLWQHNYAELADHLKL